MMRFIEDKDESMGRTGFIDLNSVLKLSEHVVACCNLEKDVQTTCLRVT